MCTHNEGEMKENPINTQTANCMLKGLNFKCNIHGTEREDVGRSKDDEILAVGCFEGYVT